MPAEQTALLQHLDIPIPCTASWDGMQGNEQVRHCTLCRKNVYNLSAMPHADAALLLAGNVDGALCVRFYRRSDGTVMTSDCSVAPRVRLRRAMRALPRVAAGVAGAAAMVAAVAQVMPNRPDGAGVQPPAARASAKPDELPMGTVLMGAPPAMQMPEQKAPARRGKQETTTPARTAGSGKKPVID